MRQTIFAGNISRRQYPESKERITSYMPLASIRNGRVAQLRSRLTGMLISSWSWLTQGKEHYNCSWAHMSRRHMLPFPDLLMCTHEQVPHSLLFSTRSSSQFIFTVQVCSTLP